MGQKDLHEDIESGQYTAFRKLLKAGMTGHTQKELCAKTGVSRSTINRFLNSESIVRPSKRILYALSQGLSGGITYSELLTSCGYEANNLDAMAETVKMSVDAGIDAMRGMKFANVKEIFEKMSNYLPFSGKIKTREVTDELKGCSLPGDIEILGTFWWLSEPYYGKTYFIIGIIKALDGYVVVSGGTTGKLVEPLITYNSDTEKFNAAAMTVTGNYIENSYRKREISASQRLIDGVMGLDVRESYITGTIGMGFDISGMDQARFYDFFCGQAKEIEGLSEILEKTEGRNFEYLKKDEFLDIFDNFVNDDPLFNCDSITEMAVRDNGLGAVLAYMMTRTLSTDDKRYIFHHYEQKHSDGLCSMVICPDIWDEDLTDDMIEKAVQIAKELGVKSGILNFQYYVRKSPNIWYTAKIDI